MSDATHEIEVLHLHQNITEVLVFLHPSIEAEEIGDSIMSEEYRVPCEYEGHILALDKEFGDIARISAEFGKQYGLTYNICSCGYLIITDSLISCYYE